MHGSTNSISGISLTSREERPDGSETHTTKDPGWVYSTEKQVDIKPDGTKTTQDSGSVNFGVAWGTEKTTTVTTPDGRTTVDTTERTANVGVPAVGNGGASMQTGTTMGGGVNAAVGGGYVANGGVGASVQTVDGQIVGGGANAKVDVGSGVLAHVGGGASSTIDPVTGGRDTSATLEAKNVLGGVGGEYKQGDVMNTSGQKTGDYAYGGLTGPLGSSIGAGQRTENGTTDQVSGMGALGGGVYASSKDGVGWGPPADRVSGKSK